MFLFIYTETLKFIKITYKKKPRYLVDPEGDYIIKMENKEYRIVEYHNEFKIQLKEIVKVSSGYLWWKKYHDNIVWRDLGENGNLSLRLASKYNYYSYYIPPQFYSTIEEAQVKLETFKKGVIYHYM